ncbi:MAG: M14 family metallopeptidase [Armatimonadetes bacterium]|nr:M14 family metallopeptidase [Armatimonadota bacterium]
MLLPVLLFAAQAWPQSKAELSNYEATSSYQEVVSFMNECQKLGAPMTMQWIGESTEGRKIPLAVISSPPVQSAAEARKLGKLVVYIQGNIHAGEVEGKEAALHLLRKIGQDSAAGGSKWLKHMVILMNPIYNADGNEKWGPVETNRPEQDGPKIVGVRANGQGFDLNRDCIKAESPEMRAALDHIYGPWDPDAMLDLHTTDGTRHGFDLTYAAPNNPNTDPRILSYSRDKLLPEVRRESVAQFGKDLFDYGSGSLGASPKWSTFEAFGRYETNYAGLANRIGILSEATTFIPFKDRILATERFVSSVLDHFCKDQATILKMRVPQPLPKEMGVRFDMAQGRVEDIPIEKLAPGEPQPLGGRPKVLEMIRMPVFDRFVSTKMARVPVEYLVPRSESKTLRLLLRHGIQMSAAERSLTRKGEVFTITKFTQAPSAFQGHKLITLDGTFRAGTVQVSSGDYIVPTNQPLGRLVFSLLEPEGEDGVAAWGFMGENLDGEFAIKKLW